MPGLTELTVVGDAGRVRIQLEDHSDVTVADILLATAAPCTGIAETAVDTAIETGRLQLLDGERELPVDQLADVIDHDSVLIRLLGNGKDRSRRQRPADPPTTAVALRPSAPTDVSPAPADPALRTPAAASLPALPPRGTASPRLSSCPAKPGAPPASPARTAPCETPARRATGCPPLRR